MSTGNSVRTAGNVVATTGNTMAFLDLDAFNASPLVREPFEYLITPGFLKAESRQSLNSAFPRIDKPGSFPVSELRISPLFAELLAELQGPAFTQAVAAKFGIADLAEHPTMVTVRGRCQKKDGRIHTDTASKIITVLVYMNERWDDRSGRLRLLRSATDLEDVIAEVPPEWGTLLIFRRSDNSFHGHKPFVGERRALQLNWVTDQSVVDHEQTRHRLSARLKRLNPFA